VYHVLQIVNLVHLLAYRQVTSLLILHVLHVHKVQVNAPALLLLLIVLVGMY